MAGLGLGAVLVAAWAHPWMGFIAGGTLVAGMLAAAWGVRSVAGRLLRGLRQEWAGERRPGADAAALVADRATAAAQAQGREACRRRALAVQLVAGAGLLVLTGVGAVLMRSGSLGVGACIGLLLAATTATMRCEGIAPVIGGLAAASIGRRRLERLPAAAPAVRPAVPAVPRRIPCPA
jgi:hypothetical protein